MLDVGKKTILSRSIEKYDQAKDEIDGVLEVLTSTCGIFKLPVKAELATNADSMMFDLRITSLEGLLINVYRRGPLVRLHGKLFMHPCKREPRKLLD